MDRHPIGARAVAAPVRIARSRRDTAAPDSAAPEGPAAHPSTTNPPPRAGEVRVPDAGPPVPAMSAGTRLSGRYLLRGVLSHRLDAMLWRSTDEVLGRDVSVLVIGADDPRAGALLAAAGRAATASEQHFLRVYDADSAEPRPGEPVVYVVQEWVSGRSLTNLLAGGPVDPQRAALLTRELAEAVAAVHDAGLTHRVLTPDRVLVAANGAVRIVGLEVAATLAGLPGTGTAADRATDVRALGALFYAGLTGRWPLADAAARPAQSVYRIRDPGPGSLLPSAPRRHDRVLGPRQVRPGIPRGHDLLALRALGRDTAAGGPVTSARQLAGLLGEMTAPAVDANAPLPPLRDLAATALLPAGTAPGAGSSAGGAGPVGASGGPGLRAGGRQPDRAMTPTTPGASAAGPVAFADAGSRAAGPDLSGMTGPAVTAASTSSGSPRDPADDRHATRRTRGARLAVGAAVAVVAVGGGLLAWQAASQLGVRGPAGLVRDAQPPAPLGPAAAAGAQRSSAAMPGIAVGSVRDFDPEGADGRENAATTALAVDGDAATAWRTSRYTSARLGGLKDGVGLVLDLGSVRSVNEVDLGLLGTGTDVQLRTAGVAAEAPRELSGFSVVAEVDGAGADARLRPPSPVLTRYLLVWLTQLPRDGSWYRGGIRALAVHG